MEPANDTWSFSGYEKIAETSSGWILSDAETRKFKQTKWVVTEKIHGANFCFVVSEDGIFCGSRRGLLAPGENFFNHKSVLNTLKGNIQAVHKLANDNGHSGKALIFGEIFGGKYPHPDVVADESVEPVQTGIWYSPKIEFCAFDLAIEAPNDQGQYQRKYLDFEEAQRIFETAGLLCVQPLFTGAYEKCLDFNIQFQSTIPKRLGLPPLANNKAEGVVIKPLRTIMVPTKKGMVRATIKNKIEEFKEDAKFHQAEKWQQSSDKMLQYGGMPPFDVLCCEFGSLITTQRLDNAISKIGRVTKEDKVKLKELFDLYVQDVLDQLEDSFDAQWSGLSGADKAALRKLIQKDTSDLLKVYFGIESKK